MSGDIVEQAKAVLRADIEAAKAATPGPWVANDGVVWGNRIQVALTRLFGRDAPHIVRQSPDRVIRQAEAMLAILEKEEPSGGGLCSAEEMRAGHIALDLARAILGPTATANPTDHPNTEET